MATQPDTLGATEKHSSPLHDVADSLRSLADAARAVFFSVLLLLLFIPPITKHLLRAYGLQIKEVSSKDGIVLEQIEQSQNDAKAAGTAIASNQQQLPQIKAALQSLLEQVKEPAVRAQVSTALQDLDQAVANNTVAASSVGNTIVKQSQAYETASTTTASQASNAAPNVSEGWLYLGSVDASQKNWLQNGPLSVFSAPLPLTPGQALVLAGPALIRGDENNGQHASAPVVGALPKNTRMTVEAVDSSHAKNNNFFMWVKVKAES